MAIKDLKRPNNEKNFKSFFGAIQYLSKYIDNLSAQTDSLRHLLKKDNKWLWTEERTQAFENLKQKITDTVSGSLQFKLSERYNNRRQYERPRCNTLARTARRKTKTNRFRKPIFRYWKYAINELELFVVVWGL